MAPATRDANRPLRIALGRSLLGRSLLGCGFLGLAITALLAAYVGYQARANGVSWTRAAERMLTRSDGPTESSNEEPAKGEKIDFLSPRPIGLPFTTTATALPKISNVKIVDLDGDSLLDVVVCDCEANLVSWIRQTTADTYTEHVLADDIPAPAHVDVVDFDKDGDLDLLIAVLGTLFPSDERIGSVVILANDGNEEFVKHVVVEQVARVSDVRGGDLDGDGDLDLAVAQFGYDYGETRWIENLGDWNFEHHILQRVSGGIHCEIADMNQDGFLDLALLVSQEWEEIYIFAGDGKGHFSESRIFSAENKEFGSSGIWVSDLDSDGDQDVLYTNGDAMDYLPPHPWPWHGIQWLENQGDLKFVSHRIADFGGAVGAHPADIDQDGDLDLYVVSTFNAWDHPASQSMIWLENLGKMRFLRHDITNTPTHVQAIDLGDLDGDGDLDIVTGGMHVSTPFDRVERILLWKNDWATTQSP
jgi:hypothetical protein